MLFNLTNKKKQTFKIPAASIGAALFSPFDPFNLPGVRSGLLMNFTNDLVPGTINPVLANRRWYDAGNLNLNVKCLAPNQNTQTTLINGFNSIDLSGVVTYYQNVSVDMLTGLTDVSFLIGFKRVGLATTNHYILYARNSANTIVLNCRITPAGLLAAIVTVGANSASLLSVNRYDDSLEHCFVLRIDQVNKTIDLVTDKNENLSNTNLAMAMPVLLTPSSASNFVCGNLNTYAGSLNPGVLNDVLIFNRVVTGIERTSLMTWEKTRIGI